MSPQTRKRVGITLGVIGVGTLLAGFLYNAHRKKSLAGLGFLIRPKYRLVDRKYAPAPLVGSFEAGGMRMEHRRSASMPIEKRVASMQSLVWAGVQDPRMRKLALQVTKHCPERDGLCEARAVYDYVKKNVRYTGDIAPVRMPDPSGSFPSNQRGNVEGIDLFQSGKRTLEFQGGDCLPVGTLMLVEGHKFVPIEELIIGSKIWGRDAWTTVKDVWFKGMRQVDAVHLNNGSTFMATDEHKVYVALCGRHTANRASGPCSCPIEERSIERLTVAQLEPGMVLIQPERIPFGEEPLDSRRALLEGLFISDGWVGHANDFDISGRDGHPKEAQKCEVREICASLGLKTTWFEKSIRVFDKEWTQRMRQMGGKAWLKHALSIGLVEDAARELLRGIMADSGMNTNGNGSTFTTTSRELMLQTRVLHRMFGRSCSERYIVDHGGEGEHPIWRLGVRDDTRSDGHAVKLLRVKEIDRAVAEKAVYDISTEDHYVYLPEADVVVSNCDDHGVLSATLLAHNGITPRFRVTAETRNGDDTHVYTVAGLPKTAPRKWVALDSTLPGSDRFGVEFPAGRVTDFPA